MSRTARKPYRLDGGEHPSRREALTKGSQKINEAAMSIAAPDVVWFALFVPSGKEFVVQRSFLSLGWPAFLPHRRKYRRLSRFDKSKRLLSYAAVPGVVFVPARQGDWSWVYLLHQTFVRGVLGVGNRPRAIASERFIEFIDGNAKQGKFDVPAAQRFMRTYEEFDVGDRVRIVEGVFDGHIVDVRTIAGSQARVLVELFGAEREIGVSLDKLEKAS